MKFQQENGKVDVFQGTGTLIGRASPGKYVLLTVAHNFEACNKDLMSAVFILHRDGYKQFTACFKVLTNTIQTHPEFDPDTCDEEGIYQGHDIALAIV